MLHVVLLPSVKKIKLSFFWNLKNLWGKSLSTFLVISFALTEFIVNKLILMTKVSKDALWKEAVNIDIEINVVLLRKVPSNYLVWTLKKSRL